MSPCSHKSPDFFFHTASSLDNHSSSSRKRPASNSRFYFLCSLCHCFGLPQFASLFPQSYSCTFQNDSFPLSKLCSCILNFLGLFKTFRPQTPYSFQVSSTTQQLDLSLVQQASKRKGLGSPDFYSNPTNWPLM